MQNKARSPLGVECHKMGLVSVIFYESGFPDEKKGGRSMEREEAFSRVVEAYGQELLRYCHHILCDYQEAQDAVQTAFLKAWERWDRAPAGEGLRPWLYRVCYTGCMDILRRRKRGQNAFREPPREPDYMGPELRQALGMLTAQERGLVFQRVMEGWSYRELEELYHVPAATLRKRYERARDKLAGLLTWEEETNEAG